MPDNSTTEERYKKTIDFLYAQLPMYQKIGVSAFKKDLNNIKELCSALGNVHEKLTCIHIAGTNGKGSCSSMLASIFQEAGYKTGLYTSPHYLDFRERIKINGEYISQEAVINFVETNKALIQKVEPSFFEITVAMAFNYFVNEKVDIAIIETGLGGRLDSTNIIHPELSIITNISFDHTNMLGNTLEAIAFEKAGIIKKGVPVVIGEKKEETQTVFSKKAKENNATIYFAEENYSLEVKKKDLLKQVINVYRSEKLFYELTELDLLGKYQHKNMRTVLMAIELLADKWKLSENAVRRGLKKVQKNTNFIGRFQILNKKPVVIADAAHNESGIKNLLDHLSSFGFENITFVLGFVKDKNIDAIIDLLPKQAEYYVTEPEIFRKLTLNKLSDIFSDKKISHNKSINVKFALTKLILSRNNERIICITGSSFLVADAIKAFKELKI